MKLHRHKWFKAGIGVADGRPLTTYVCQSGHIAWRYDDGCAAPLHWALWRRVIWNFVHC